MIIRRLKFLSQLLLDFLFKYTRLFEIVKTLVLIGFECKEKRGKR